MQIGTRLACPSEHKLKKILSKESIESLEKEILKIRCLCLGAYRIKPYKKAER